MPRAARSYTGLPAEQGSSGEIATAVAECLAAVKQFRIAAMRLGATPQSELAAVEFIAGMGRLREVQDALKELATAEYINAQSRITQASLAEAGPALHTVDNAAARPTA
jgi:hypothetical protein